MSWDVVTVSTGTHSPLYNNSGQASGSLPVMVWVMVSYRHILTYVNFSFFLIHFAFLIHL